MPTLEQEFENELLEKMLTAKIKCHYNPTYFNQMLAEIGGVATAKRLIQKAMQSGEISDGFKKLLSLQRLDLTMEDSVCKEKYKELFSTDEINFCKQLLGRK